MNKIYIFNETNSKLKKEEKHLKKLLNKVLKKEKIKNAEFNLIFVDKPKIREINRDYRNKDSETDVISFALEDNKLIETKIRILGDIYLCIDKVVEQSIEYKHSYNRELSFLALHGLLHLLGYDHMDKKDEEIMFKKQEDLLNEFKITR
ncbi:MAG: rRNA maturation RNase YbeY [Bacilli bacterium]|nr:rRNA maturation RNase YbeY [Bacilli bacterium]